MKSRFNQQNFKENLAGYLFILPNFLGVFLFVVFPLLFSLVMVFIDWDYMMGFSGIEWVGLAHFKKLMTDEYFLQSLKNNFIFTAVTVPAAMAIGLVIAVILNKFVYLKNFLRVLFFLPYVSSIVAISIVWSVMYNPANGPINGALRSLGVENLPGWLASPDWSLTAIIIMVVWTYTGYTMVLYMAGFKGCPRICTKRLRSTELQA